MQAPINGTTIHYTEAGNPTGLAVLFVHGFPFSSAMWKTQMEAAGLEHRAVAYDIRGLGLSPVGDGQYTLDQHADDLLALLDHLAIEQAVIVGLSMGGYVALRAMEKSPERFQGLALCDTRSEADDDAGRLKRAAAAVNVKRDGASAFADGFVKAVFAPGSFEALPDAVSFIHGVIAGTSPLAIAGHLIAMAARTDTTPGLGNITAPTLIMVGEHDAVTPPDLSRAMHERIAGSELKVVPDAGHMSNLENPDFFNAQLMAFLQKCGG